MGSFFRTLFYLYIKTDIASRAVGAGYNYLTSGHKNELILSSVRPFLSTHYNYRAHRKIKDFQNTLDKCIEVTYVSIKREKITIVRI